MRVQTKQLRSQTKPHKVAQRMQAALDPTAAKQPVPGVESLMVNRRHQDVVSMLHCKKAIADICHATLTNDTVNVYNIEFVPREYLYDALSNNIKTHLRQLAVRDKNVERSARACPSPSALATGLTRCFLTRTQAYSDSVRLPRHDLRVPGR